MSYSRLDLVSAHVQAGELDDALRLLDQQLSEQPDDDDARRWRAAVLMHLPGDEAQRAALADLDALRTPIPDDALRRSIALQTLGDLTGANAVIDDARASWPDDETLIERRLYLLTLAHDHSAAEALLATLPRTWRWLLWAADLARERARDTDSIALYSEALTDLERSLDSRDPFVANLKAQAFLGRARVLATTGAYADADADFAAAQSILPQDPMIDFQRGLLASLQSDMIQALALCGDALTAASEQEQQQMEHILRHDPRHAALAMLLLQGDADI